MRNNGNPPSPRESFSMTSTDDKVYVFGGFSNNESKNDFYQFNLKTNRWKDLS